MTIINNLKKIYTIIKDVFLNLIYYLSKIVPKSRNIWILGSNTGEMFTDNSKYLFLYLQNYLKNEIKSIWISNNKILLKELTEHNFTSFYKWSLRGIYYTMRAKIVILTHGEADVNMYLASGIRINLWHGAPLKKIGYKNLHPNNYIYKIYFSKGWRRLLFKITKSSIFREYDYINVTSNFYKKIFSRDFNMDKQKIIVYGYPRNDILASPLDGMYIGVDKKILDTIRAKKEEGKQIILYMPTFREFSEFHLKDIFNFSILNQKLEEMNYYLVLKVHSHTKNCNDEIISNNIGLCISRSDPQPLLSDVDILITDYSSVYFDFLFLNKPIIFYAYDLDNYLKTEREMYFKYENITPGKIVKTFNELIEALQEISQNRYNYHQKISEVKNKIFKYSDNHSSRRIVNFISKKLLNIEIDKKEGNY